MSEFRRRLMMMQRAGGDLPPGYIYIAGIKASTETIVNLGINVGIGDELYCKSNFNATSYYMVQAGGNYGWGLIASGGNLKISNYNSQEAMYGILTNSILEYQFVNNKWIWSSLSKEKEKVMTKNYNQYINIKLNNNQIWCYFKIPAKCNFVTVKNTLDGKLYFYDTITHSSITDTNFIEYTI